MATSPSPINPLIGVLPSITGTLTDVDRLKNSYAKEVNERTKSLGEKGEYEAASAIFAVANSERANITDAATLNTVIEATNKAIAQIDEASNPNRYANNRLTTAIGTAASPADFQTLDLAAFENRITVPGGAGARNPFNPEAVKTEGRKLLAGLHLNALGSVDTLSQADIDAHIAGITHKHPELEKGIRDEYQKRINDRVQDFTNKLTADRPSAVAEIKALIGSATTPDGPLKDKLKGLIKQELDAETIATEAGTIETGLTGKNGNEVAAEILASPAFTGLDPDVQAAMKLDIDIEQKKKEISDLNSQIDKEEKQAEIKEKKRALRDATKKEWGRRFTIAAKVALIGGLIGLVAGTGGTALFGALSQTSVLAVPGAHFAIAVGGLSGAGAAVYLNKLAIDNGKFDDEALEAILKDKRKAQKAFNDLGTAIQEMDASKAKKEVNYKSNFVKLYTDMYAQSNKLNNKDLQTKVLENLKLSDLKTAYGMVNAAFGA